MTEEKTWNSSAHVTTISILMAICAATFWIAPIRAPFDSFFTIHTAYSLLHGGWGNLSQFIDINPTHHSVITGADGQPYSVYPIGTVIFSLPFVMIADAVVPNFASLLRHPAVSMELEALTVAFWCAAATAMVFHLAVATTRNVNIGLAAAFIFAFCSPVLSTATRALWQHGPMVVCVAATLLLLRSAESRPKVIPWIAIPVALAFLSRPLAVPFVIAVTVFVAVCHTKRLLPFVFVGAGIAILWASFNYVIWGHILPPYYQPGHYTYQEIPLFDLVFGSLISPSRGILVFSPIFLICLFSVALKIKNRTLDRFDVLCITVTLAYVGMIAISPLWWAGHSYGPRFMTDVVPLLTYLMLPSLQAISKPQGGTGRQLGAITVLFLAAVSFLINAMGALTIAPYRWNSEPSNIDYSESYGRLWDWRDLQFLRGTALEYGYHPSLQILGLLEIIRAPSISSDQIIDLSVTNSADATLVSGWSGLESWGVWSNGAEAQLRLPLPMGINDDLKLDFQAKAFVTDSHPSVTVTVMSAGETVGVWQFSMQAPSGTRSLAVPKRLLSQEALDLTFLIDTPTSPRAVWNAEDDRLLGLGLSKIRLIW